MEFLYPTEGIDNSDGNEVTGKGRGAKEKIRSKSNQIAPFG